MAADTPRLLPDGRLSIHALCLPENVPLEPHPQALYYDADSTNTPLSAYSSNTTAYTSSADDDETMSFTSGLSIDDPDVRLAAEALEDLRCGMYRCHISYRSVTIQHPAQAAKSVRGGIEDIVFNRSVVSWLWGIAAAMRLYAIHVFGGV
ncbi:hypothetical protein LIPSTDRAFT_265633 [Lipomyces starkeyi NRRL Y-11557]|uniref:Uncharacterized protein n=1 Tax=Lipomyces starkeyi NRRL Y-11557 TaxID=675824 RepID=A0A1E3Q7D7_LIPST|nr:hypothetical protein LIPSTDRAFT_265633 [Lipomyces starkeyi NRRL Y-11557]